MCLKVPRVTKCCFCFSLRTGSLIIGYISLINTVSMMIACSVLIYLLSVHTREGTIQPPPGHDQEEVLAEMKWLYYIFGFQILIYLFYFVLSLLLVIGVHKNKPSYMRYFYVGGLAVLVAHLIMVIVGFVYTGFVATVPQLLSCAIFFYFLLVIRSTYLEIEERANKPAAYEMRSREAQQALMV